MKRLLALLLVAGCSSKSQIPDQKQTSERAEPQPGFDLANAAAQSSGSPASLQQRAIAALAGHVSDPQKAQFSELRTGVDGALCGTVEAADLPGRSPRPFIVAP